LMQEQPSDDSRQARANIETMIMFVQPLDPLTL
jgi:hypothetical protein